MDKRINVQEMFDYLAKEIEKGNGHKTISVAEYYLGKPSEEGDEYPFAIGFGEIFYEDVEYTNEEKQYKEEDLKNWKLKNKDFLEKNQIEFDIVKERSLKDEKIKEYFNYIAYKMNMEKDSVKKHKEELKAEINKLKAEIMDKLLSEYSDYLIEKLEEI